MLDVNENSRFPGISCLSFHSWLPDDLVLDVHLQPVLPSVHLFTVGSESYRPRVLTLLLFTGSTPRFGRKGDIINFVEDPPDPII